VDFVAKPKIGVADGLRQLGADITDKIRTAAQGARAAPGGTGHRRGRRPGAAGAGADGPLGRLSTEKIIFIGASTGGTEATREVLVNLPADFPA
jgi:two-component system chemotaxis response regulator CheB